MKDVNMALTVCRKILWVALLAVFSVVHPLPVTALDGSQATPQAIIGQDVDAQTLAMLTPVAAQLGQQGAPALLCVASEQTLTATHRMIDQIGPARVLLIHPHNAEQAFDAALTKDVHTLSLPSSHLETGVCLARQFWNQPQTVVLASDEEPSTLLYASALAGQRRVPLLAISQPVDQASLQRSLTALGVKQAMIVWPEGEPVPAWFTTLPCPVELLQGEQVQDALIKTLGVGSIRNIIVARAPDQPVGRIASAWMAAYLSVARHSVIVLAPSQEVEVAERMVNTAVQEYGLKPRTVTLLADYDGLVEHEVVIPVGDDVLEIAIEPCSAPGVGGAADYGVGRIPYSDAANASMLIAWGLLREMDQSQQAGGLLMIANPNPDYGALPLAETIARITESEFVNLKVPMRTHFGIRPDPQQAQDDAAMAQLIIYQGHITDHQLFGSGQYWDEESGYMEQEYENSRDSSYDQQIPAQEESASISTSRTMVFHQVISQVGEYVSPQLSVLATTNQMLDLLPNSNQLTALDDASTEDVANGHSSMPEDVEHFYRHAPSFPRPDSSSNNPILKQHALVFLQSCSSLHDEATQVALANDACGVIGSVTSIHSASGSSFVKAWSDAVLYRDATAGEAMRDARNYFLLLVELKKARGHTQQAKTMRVGLSFRLLGDPEMQVLPGNRALPRYAPVTGVIKEHTINFQTPDRSLKQVETDRYVIRAFPGCQTAGIVKRIKDKEYRRLMPLYFLRLPIPADNLIGKGLVLQRQNDTGTRAVYTIDSLGRYLYVVYFPESLEKNETIQLEFSVPDQLSY
jgi:hypothetical protein